jgi:hypothetical protein
VCRIKALGRLHCCALSIGGVEDREHWATRSGARKSWCESNDPESAAKAADVVGPYINPPAKAIVLCVDEKPSIQALKRGKAI